MKLLTPFLLIVSAIGFFIIFVNPHYKNVTELRAQSLEYDNAIARAQTVVAKKDLLVAKYSSYNPADIKRLQQMIPSKIDNIQLILDVNGVAKKQGVQINGIKISVDTSQKQVSVGADQALYNSMVLGFGVTMNYEKFQLFLKDLERSLQLMDIASVSFSPAEDGQNNYSLVLKAYWLK
jgi:hypothetical protein